MFTHLGLVIAALCSAQAFPHPQNQQTASRPDDPKQVLYVPDRQQFRPELQYDLPLVDPQFQLPAYNFIGEKQHFPRVQPQIFLYHGGAAPGQPFLLQPGSPPGNFLVPQGGPNVIIRDAPTPPRPVFVAGYPKPAHIPPIEKDAEEVPTNPSKIPPLTTKGKKPEKLETFNEDDNSKKQATEADVLAAADRNPAFNPRPSLRPGQRFFILNGQPLFSNYPYNNQIYPGIQSNVNLKYGQISPNFIPQTPSKSVSPFPNVLLRSGQIENNPEFTSAQLQQNYPENLVLLNQPGSFQDGVYRNPANLEQIKDDKAELREQVNGGSGYDLLQLRDNGEQDDDAVVIDAGEYQQDSAEPEEAGEVVSAANKPSEPTISQAQPGAIALAGPGGVAAAAPRGTAFVGREGVAVSSPQATAVAGPSRDEVVEEKKKKQGKRRP